ncbi:MAG: GGDEF domain-containing protein [Rectinemataceae bacterium]
MNKRTELFIRLLGPKEIKLNQAIIIVIGTTALVFVVDYITPNELAFSFFYLIPIALSMLVGGNRVLGYVSAVLCGIVWMAMRLLVGTVYTLPFFLIWSLLTRIATYVLFAFLLDSLKQAVAELQELSLHDPLTGAANRRYLEEYLERSISRSRRDKEPLTLIAIDLDDFKSINDKFGHARGDETLKTMAEAIRTVIRPEDLVSRIGGDEFVIVLSTKNFEQSETVTARLSGTIRKALSDIQIETTLSIGVITNATMKDSAETMLQQADRLMYEVKNGGKNGRKHIMVGEPTLPEGPDTHFPGESHS